MFYGYAPAHVRVNRQTPLKQYLGDMMLLLRLVLSLRRVGTTLPMHLYLSGERHAKYERLFQQQGVHLSEAPYTNPARWANPWHAGTFAKLHALSLSAFDTVLVLAAFLLDHKDVPFLDSSGGSQACHNTSHMRDEGGQLLIASLPLLQAEADDNRHTLTDAVDWRPNLRSRGAATVKAPWRGLHRNLPGAADSFI